MHKLLIPFILLIVALSGCTKAKSPKWLVVDLSVNSTLNNKPINARVELEYFQSWMLGSHKEKVDLGYTDENGKMYIEQRVERKTGSFRLNIYAYGGYEIPSSDHGPTYVVTDLNKQQKNVVQVKLDPVYYYKITLKNTNCFNEQDTVWLSENSLPYAGCLNTTLHPWLPDWSFSPELHFDIKVKRNGVVTYLTKDFILNHDGEINDVVIEY